MIFILIVLNSSKIKCITYNNNISSIIMANIKLIIQLIINWRSSVLMFPSPYLILSTPFIYIFCRKLVTYIGVDYNDQ